MEPIMVQRTSRKKEKKKKRTLVVPNKLQRGLGPHSTLGKPALFSTSSSALLSSATSDTGSAEKRLSIGVKIFCDETDSAEEWDEAIHAPQHAWHNCSFVVVGIGGAAATACRKRSSAATHHAEEIVGGQWAPIRRSPRSAAWHTSSPFVLAAPHRRSPPHRRLGTVLLALLVILFVVWRKKSPPFAPSNTGRLFPSYCERDAFQRRWLAGGGVRLLERRNNPLTRLVGVRRWPPNASDRIRRRGSKPGLGDTSSLAGPSLADIGADGGWLPAFKVTNRVRQGVSLVQWASLVLLLLGDAHRLSAFCLLLSFRSHPTTDVRVVSSSLPLQQQQRAYPQEPKACFNFKL